MFTLNQVITALREIGEFLLDGGILWIEFIFPHEEKIEYSRSKYVDSQTELVLNVSSEKMDGYWQYTSTIEKFSVGIN